MVCDKCLKADCDGNCLITTHSYDAGWPRDDSEGCIAWDGTEDDQYMCRQPLAAHATSKYPEDD